MKYILLLIAKSTFAPFIPWWWFAVIFVADVLTALVKTLIKVSTKGEKL